MTPAHGNPRLLRLRWIGGAVVVLLLGTAASKFSTLPVSAAVGPVASFTSGQETFHAYTAWLAESHAHAARHGQDSPAMSQF